MNAIEEYLTRINEKWNNEWQICDKTDFQGQAKPLILFHIICEKEVEKSRANRFIAANCPHCKGRRISEAFKNKTQEEKDLAEQRKQATNLERYGVAQQGQRKENIEKAKQTNLERYGTEHPVQSEKVKQKIKETNLERYGVECTLQVPEVKEKIKETLQGRYGVDHPLKSQEVKEKLIETNLERYGVEWTGQSNIVKQKAKQTMVKRYGFENAGQVPEFIEKRQNTIFERYGSYRVNHSKAQIELFYFISSIYKGEIIQDVPILKNESLVRDIDIYLPDLKIGIEYHGIAMHDSSPNHPFKDPKDKNYHLEKLKLAEDKGIRLIQIFSDEWENNKEIVKSKILSILKLNKLPIIGARNCIIKEISKQEKDNFLNANHIQGADNSSIKLGLFYKDELVGVMTFIKGIIWNLSRFALDIKYSIPGAFPKMLKYAIEIYKPNKIKSFADLRWSSALSNIYLSNNFIQKERLIPSYWYSKKDSERLHKFGFRKTDIIKNNPQFKDQNKTEFEMMNELKYHRVYDCGLLRYELDLTREAD